MNIQAINIAQTTPESSQLSRKKAASGDAAEARPAVKNAQAKASELQTEKASVADSRESADRNVVEDDKLADLAEEIAEFGNKMNRELSFSVDRDLGRVVIKVSKPATEPGGEDTLIRQIPSEEMLDLARRLQDMRESEDMKGFMFSRSG